MLSAAVHAALSQLLEGLQSPDNLLRSQSEENLNIEWITARPDVLLMGLTEHVQGAEDASVRGDTIGQFRRRV